MGSNPTAPAIDSICNTLYNIIGTNPLIDGGFTLEYLNTIRELQAKASEKLGSMSDGNYEFFFRKANKLAGKFGIKRPKLGIDIKFKPGAHEFLSETTYPISEADDWDRFLKDARTMCEYVPNVYLIDGDKYTLPL